MNGHSGPLSPKSTQGSEWSGVSHYQYTGQPPYSPTLPHNRGNLVTPPISGSSNGTQPRMSNGMNGRGAPSPPSSVTRSSYGTTLSSSEGHRRKTLQMEERLSQHYSILKRFLAQSLRDEKGNPKPNRARDKLLRLSAVQFQELSTDVYDELLRRQSSSGQQRNGPGQVPEYLLPKENFHPKRNQARQKLATLPPPRFQDLATDVFYELERRFPMFAGRDISRMGSPAVSQYGAPPSRVGTPNGTRQHYAPRNASLGSQVMAGLGIPGVESNDGYGRPTAKTSQSNTIIPNKSTMVEDDDDDASDIYGSRRDTTFTSRSVGGFDKDRKIADFETQVGDYENRVSELQDKVKELEILLRDKTSELDQVHGFHNQQQSTSEAERHNWSTVQSDLEAKLTQARHLNSNLQMELDKARETHYDTEQELRSQMDLVASEASGGGEWKERFETLNREHEDLSKQLSRQERITNEVRQEAAGWLNQMKILSERSSPSLEYEERLVHQVHTLENELQEWKGHYAKMKTQLRTSHFPSMGTSIQPPDVGGAAKDLMAQDGLVEEVHVTKFQIAMDDLLRSARGSNPNTVLTHVRSVVIAVRGITMVLGDTRTSIDETTQIRHKLRTRASATANNLITAAKNFAMAKGLSPVSLLDAAASHVAAVVVELIRLVKIRPTPAEEFQDDDENSVIADSPADYYGIYSSQANTGVESLYGSMNSARPSQVSGKLSKSNALQNGIINGAGPTPSPNSMHRTPKSSSNKKIEELKGFLESRTDSLIPSIQSLVSSIRNNAEPPDVLDYLAAITSTTSQIINKTSEDANSDDQRLSDILQSLAECVDKLEDAGREGEDIGNEKDWNAFVKGLPPLAFAIAKSTKELNGWFETLGRNDDFS